MRRAFGIAALVMVPALAEASTARYVVALKAGVSAERAATFVRDVEATPESRDVVSFKTLDQFAADLTDAEVAELRRTPGVRYVEEVGEVRILGVPGVAETEVFRNLNGQTVPEGLDVVRARDVWGVTRGESINVVVIDTGVDYRHPDIADAWAGGFNAVAQNNDPMDDNNHGTHVAGTIAAADNQVGVVGVAPKVRLWGVKALRANGTGSTDRINAGIDWVIQQKRALGGNWIINMSLGASVENQSQREAVARAVAEGILIVAASGNESTLTEPAAVAFPAAYPGVFAVGAIDARLKIASFSNQGPELAAVAPGVDVLSSVRVGGGSISAIQSARFDFAGAALTGSKRGTVSGQFVFCNVGGPTDFPSSVSGRIAVVRRGGDIKFAVKGRRAKEAGATAVVIVNNVDSALSFTLIDPEDPTTNTFDWPVTIAISMEDGDKLLADPNAVITVVNQADDYSSFNGTSMAAPHAAGVAALAWSVARTATAEAIRNALITQATDLGAAGFDNAFGHGVLDSLNAAKMLNPAAFGSPATPAPSGPPSGRRVLRRGRG